MLRVPLTRILRAGPALLFSLLVLPVAMVVFQYVRLPDEGLSDEQIPVPSTEPARWQNVTMPSAEIWRVFAGSNELDIPSGEKIASRYRLAGTFFMMPIDLDTQSIRKAVLDNLQGRTQILVQEGDVVNEIVVDQIFRDHIVLTFHGNQEELWLSFSAQDREFEPGDEKKQEDPAWDERNLGESELGRKIAENRWVLKRKELLAYRDQLLDDPERLAALFISMKPDRIDRKIEGYRLAKEGEDKFWQAVGLLENDVIRKVNSMKMTKQERAEYFIREFVQDRLNAVVLDIERDGKPLKLIYYLRE